MKNSHFNSPVWVQPILIPDEKVVWEGKPIFIPFLLTELFNVVKLLVLLSAVAIAVLIIHHYYDLGINYESFKTKVMVAGVFIFVVLSSVYGIINKMIQYRNTGYCITNKRIISYTGGFDQTYTVVEFPQLTHVNITRNGIDRTYNTGTILFKTAEMEYNHKNEGHLLFCLIESVENPFEVLRYVPQDKVQY